MADTHLFPLICPECSVADGWPLRATTIAEGGVRIDLHCQSCDHQWNQRMTEQGTLIAIKMLGEVAVRPKLDRRQAKG